MTNKSLSTDFDRTFNTLARNFLGIPSTLGATYYSNNTSNYPPYDIIQTEDESQIELHLALAGWSKDDLEVEVEKDVLKITGHKTKSVEDEETMYLHKGISTKAFTRTFTLGADIEVHDVKYKDGILKIFMEKLIPEEDKPRLIKIR